MQHVIGCTTRPYSSVSFAEACKHIAAASYTDVAGYSHEGRTPVDSASTAGEVAEARRIAADAGLAPSMMLGGVNLKLGLAAATDNYRRLIDNAAALGVKWLLDGGTSNDDQYDDYFRVMSAAAPHAAAAGIDITLKPHGGISLSADDLINACERVDHPSFGISFDPGNIIYYTNGAERPETVIDLVAPKTSTLIIKDCVIRDGQPDVMITPGEGLVDFEQVIGGLIRGGFDGPMYLECVGGKTLDEVNRNVSATRSMLIELLSKLGQ